MVLVILVVFFSLFHAIAIYSLHTLILNKVDTTFYLYDTICCFAGPNYLQQFCQNAVHSLFSPFILYDIAMEVFSSQTRNNPALNPAQIQTLFSRTPMLSSLMQRCLQM